MNAMQQRIIAIYIHPDHGPVLPMELDLMAVELVALRGADDAQRDEIRIREIARRIKAQFPKVQPEEKRSELTSLAGRLSNYTRFNGIVLRLPGTIDEDQGNGSISSAAVKKQLEQINEQVKRLTGDLRTEQQAHDAAKVQLATLKSNYKNLRTLYDKVNTRLADAQVQEQQTRHEAQRWRKTAETFSATVDAAEQEVGAMKIAYERAQQEIQTLRTDLQEQQQVGSDKEQELSRLRQEIRNAESAVEHLEATVGKREQEIVYLRHQLEGDEDMVTDASTAEKSWTDTL